MSLFHLVFDDEPQIEEPKPETKPETKIEFTPEQQKHLNFLLAEERRKSKANTDKVVAQLQTLRDQAGTTQADRDALQARIEELQNLHTTQEELRKKEDAKKIKKHQEELEAARNEANVWRDRYTTTMIDREIIDAASKAEHRAHNPKHIVNELRPVTRLVEDLDEENKPTGRYTPRVKLTAAGKDGKTVTLDLTVTEAVKFMSEQEEHAPLFVSGATGGYGGTTSGRVRNQNDPPTDPKEYQEWRKKNRGFSGAPQR